MSFNVHEQKKKTVLDMELRDFFAGCALTGLVGAEDPEGHEEQLAKVAYDMADEMLKRRRLNKEAVRNARHGDLPGGG